MLEQFSQYNDIGLLILRLAMAIIFIYHALPKIKGAKMMAQAMGMSSGMVFMLGTIEFLSSIGLILGVYTRLSALFLTIVMVGAIYFKTAKWHVPFAAMDKTGWEFDLILLAANIAILLNGGGTITIQ